MSFQVYLDDEQVFSSGVMTCSSVQQFVDVAIEGRQTLRLLVEDAGNGIGNDHADWADAKVIVG